MDEIFPDWHGSAMEDEPKTILQLRVKERMDALGLKAAPLAKSIAKSDSFVRDILRGKSGTPGADSIAHLADALATTVDYLLGHTSDPNPDAPRQRLVPIVGLAGAGPNGSVLFAEGQGNFGEVPAPADAGPNIEALEVRGDSMHGLANDGWLIFYEDRTEPRDDYMGEPCVCWLEDGHVLVKIPEPTRHPGLFNLTSTNAPTMRDVPVGSMALVTAIHPRRAAQRYIRRNPKAPVVDLHIGENGGERRSKP